MATTTIRHLVKAALVTALTAHANLTNVTVSYGFPGDLLEQDAVWIAACNGVHYEIPVVQGGRKQRDDFFELKVIAQCGTHGDSAVTAEATVATYLAAIEDVCANDPSLTNLDGLVDVVVSQVDGPETWQTPEGAVSFFTTTVACHARYL